jgi:hypothetical protein
MWQSQVGILGDDVVVTRGDQLSARNALYATPDKKKLELGVTPKNESLAVGKIFFFFLGRAK